MVQDHWLSSNDLHGEESKNAWCGARAYYKGGRVSLCP